VPRRRLGSGFGWDAAARPESRWPSITGSDPHYTSPRRRPPQLVGPRKLALRRFQRADRDIWRVQILLAPPVGAGGFVARHRAAIG